MGRTRLFQRPGSPLIQGQSRMERPFSADWIAALVAALVLATIVVVMWGTWAGGLFDSGFPRGVLSTARIVLAMFGPGAFLGAALGVWTAKHFGAFHPSYAGTIVGVIGGIITLWTEVSVFSVTL